MSRTVITGLLLTAALQIAIGCAHSRVGAVQSPRPAGHPMAASPSGRAPTSSPTARPGEVTLPMRVVRGNGGTLVYVPMKVNGHGPYEFVLDTGSSNSSVDRSLVRRLGLPRTGQQHPVQGVTGSGMVPVVRVHRWTLGGLPMHGRSLSVVDLGIGVAGLLGSDELCRFGNVILDFRHNKLVIQRR
ncbi:retropepsin-like domain-containing protein [Actinoallomurus sp. NBC_01490]|uniref:retropepsin-like aspartic protease n=1 Tax=Actinoallomurus sp. NBC_01490 TaxID=2903557 RepID=UPI002E36264D|nr:retropepsin-like aspartic protease [Actinoallomurus sp. NBC_01490]